MDNLAVSRIPFSQGVIVVEGGVYSKQEKGNS